MFGRNKKEENQEPFNLNFYMKDEYEVDNLCVSRIHYLSNEVNDAMTPMIEKTDLLYFFEKKDDYYEEVFTGLKVGEEPESFNRPYIVNIVPLTKFKKELKEQKITKVGLLKLINDINTKKTKQQGQQKHQKRYTKNRKTRHHQG